MWINQCSPPHALLFISTDIPNRTSATCREGGQHWRRSRDRVTAAALACWRVMRKGMTCCKHIRVSHKTRPSSRVKWSFIQWSSDIIFPFFNSPFFPHCIFNNQDKSRSNENKKEISSVVSVIPRGLTWSMNQVTGSKIKSITINWENKWSKQFFFERMRCESVRSTVSRHVKIDFCLITKAFLTASFTYLWIWFCF